jgi:hypothetical protein
MEEHTSFMGIRESDIAVADIELVSFTCSTATTMYPTLAAATPNPTMS